MDVASTALLPAGPRRLASASLPVVPILMAAAGDRAATRFLEFFASPIRNPHTRRAYARAVTDFLAWCEDHAAPSIAAVQPLHVAAWIEGQTQTHAAPTVKQQLAAIRHLFDWLVTGQIIPMNPAASVRGPAYSVRQGRTPVLDPAEARTLLDSINVTTPIGLRDRALIALMVYSFGRIGAALAMKVEDILMQNRRLWARLCEKGGKAHAMPCHQLLESTFTRISTAPASPTTQRAAVPHHWPWHRPAHPYAPTTGQRLRHGATARPCCRHRYPDGQSQLSGNRHHRVLEKRRHARECRGDGEPRQHSHDAAVRWAPDEISLDEVERIRV